MLFGDPKTIGLSAAEVINCEPILALNGVETDVNLF